MLTIPADRPLPKAVCDVLRIVADATAELGIDYFVAGATARDILLHHVYGIDTGRATRDVDFAIAVENWAQFERLKERLEAEAEIRTDSKLICRLHYAAPTWNVPIDLVPFGSIEHPPGQIAWPPDRDVLMNVAGYREVLDSAEHIQVAQKLSVRVASLAGLAILKLFAWLDRGGLEPKDAHDLLVLLQRYADAGNFDRLYEDAIDVLESVNYDLELAGARLLGADARHLAAALTRQGILRILDSQDQVDRLILDMTRSLRGREDSLTYADSLITSFAAGLRAEKGDYEP